MRAYWLWPLDIFILLRWRYSSHNTVLLLKLYIANKHQSDLCVCYCIVKRRQLWQEDFLYVWTSGPYKHLCHQVTSLCAGKQAADLLGCRHKSLEKCCAMRSALIHSIFQKAPLCITLRQRHTFLTPANTTTHSSSCSMMPQKQLQRTGKVFFIPSLQPLVWSLNKSGFKPASRRVRASPSRLIHSWQASPSVVCT